MKEDQVKEIVQKMLERFDKEKVQTSIDSVNRLVSLVSRDSTNFKNMVVTHEQRLLKLEKDVDEDRTRNNIALSDLDTALAKERSEKGDAIFMLDRKLNYSRRGFNRERTDLINNFKKIQSLLEKC